MYFWLLGISMSLYSEQSHLKWITLSQAYKSPCKHCFFFFFETRYLLMILSLYTYKILHNNCKDTMWHMLISWWLTEEKFLMNELCKAEEVISQVWDNYCLHYTFLECERLGRWFDFPQFIVAVIITMCDWYVLLDRFVAQHWCWWLV